MAPSALFEHLWRRAGFGVTDADRRHLDGVRSYRDLVDSLLYYDGAAADVDRYLGTPGYVGVSSAQAFSPDTNIDHARQRWLFRFVHSPAPLREKMALFWHQHFATAHSKIAGEYGAADATRLLVARADRDPAGQRGQIDLFRERPFPRFRDLLVAVARDPAMLVWLDGRSNTRQNPQENFGRELMELFTFGVGHFAEADVYAAARVFTGWNLRVTGPRGTGTARYEYVFDAGRHDNSAKTFTFPIYGSGPSPHVIPARSGAEGERDGLDLIHALSVHPETARRLARKLWEWFVSDLDAPDPAFVESVAGVYRQYDTDMRPVMRAVLTSPQFTDADRVYRRCAWPVEFVVRSIREIGGLGFSVASALTPMLNMGQQLLEPPDVNGWTLGLGWFSTGATLARMNFASQLATNQRVALRDAARPFSASPQAVADFAFRRLSLPAPSADVYGTVVDYVGSGLSWTGSDTQMLSKTAGAIHLLAGSAEYQFL